MRAAVDAVLTLPIVRHPHLATGQSGKSTPSSERFSLPPGSLRSGPGALASDRAVRSAMAWLTDRPLGTSDGAVNTTAPRSAARAPASDTRSGRVGARTLARLSVSRDPCSKRRRHAVRGASLARLRLLADRAREAQSAGPRRRCGHAPRSLARVERSVREPGQLGDRRTVDLSRRAVLRKRIERLALMADRLQRLRCGHGRMWPGLPRHRRRSTGFRRPAGCGMRAW